MKFDVLMLWVWRISAIGWALLALADITASQWGQAFDHGLLMGLTAIVARYQRQDIERRRLREAIERLRNVEVS